MQREKPEMITVETTVHAPVDNVWTYWTEPEHITKWYVASKEWHAPKAENDLRAGGKFITRMEAKDGSFGFDFGGIYDEVILHDTIVYKLDDGRKVTIAFTSQGNTTKITEVFEGEFENSIEMQRNGWQAILDNFKTYSEQADQGITLV